MHSYSTQKKISTYTVDKTIVKSIEDFLKQDVPRILNLSNSLIREDQHKTIDLKECINIILYDSHGEEHFKTIDDYKFPFFRNDIKGLSVELNIKDYSTSPQEMKVVLRFGKTEDNSDLSIVYSGENPREKVIAIEGGLKPIMSYNKNINWLLYPNGFVMFLIILVLPIGGLSLVPQQYAKIFLYSTVLLIAIYLGAFRYLKGYCSFDSKRQKQFDTWVTWFITGLAGFVIFANVLPSIRKNLLGF